MTRYWVHRDDLRDKEWKEVDQVGGEDRDYVALIPAAEVNELLNKIQAMTNGAAHEYGPSDWLYKIWELIEEQELHR